MNAEQCMADEMKMLVQSRGAPIYREKNGTFCSENFSRLLLNILIRLFLVVLIGANNAFLYIDGEVSSACVMIENVPKEEGKWSQTSAYDLLLFSDLEERNFKLHDNCPTKSIQSVTAPFMAMRAFSRVGHRRTIFFLRIWRRIFVVVRINYVNFVAISLRLNQSFVMR